MSKKDVTLKEAIEVVSRLNEWWIDNDYASGPYAYSLWSDEPPITWKEHINFVFSGYLALITGKQ